jgi:hypothetical protein
MNEMVGIFITWCTYGSWLPGDARGWRARRGGQQPPNPALESHCRQKLKTEAVILRPHDRLTIEDACREHSKVRGWHLFAVNARTQHVHLVVAAYVKPQVARDQFKANCTRRLRIQPNPLILDRTWAKGGDCEVLYDDDELTRAIDYVLNAQ